MNKSEIKTAEDFIRIAGSRSSVSGEPYRIRLPDGREVESATGLKEQLAIIDSEA